jgi:ABC-2 type transport system ATP-binding protein
MLSIETHQLTHRFRSGEIAVNQLNLQVPEGSVYGFLGPNGAGKTTTLRILLGLLKKQESEVRILGKTIDRDRNYILSRIGSLIESPSLYLHLTALENLKIYQLVYACKPSRMQEVLKLVGLGDVGSKKVEKFSLGMKQRLALAVALLHEPRLLILDEPSNGLDPNGMIELRQMIRNLNEQHGITILVSSHILAEVEKIVTHVGVIHRGTFQFQGTVQELDAIRQKAGVKFEVSDALAAQKLLGSEHFTLISPQTFELHQAQPEKIARANKILNDQNIQVYSVVPQTQDLESVFLHLTQA